MVKNVLYIEHNEKRIQTTDDIDDEGKDADYYAACDRGYIGIYDEEINFRKLIKTVIKLEDELENLKKVRFYDMQERY